MFLDSTNITLLIWKEGAQKSKENGLRSFKPFMGHMDLASAWFSVFQSLCFLKVQCSPALLLKGESVCGNLLQFSRGTSLPLLFFFFVCPSLDSTEGTVLQLY